MTATLQQHQDEISATLFVTNTGKAAYSSPACPSVSVVVLTPDVQVSADKARIDCPEDKFTVAARSSLALPIRITVPRGVNLTLANVTGSLSVGLSDDASRSRTDA